MLWGLEALRVFDDRLSASLTEIQKARETLESTIKQELGPPHPTLLQSYTTQLTAFTKRHLHLTTVHLIIQQKINQLTNLQDSISTVTNVEDSRTALRDSRITIKQGNNISVLTLITIAYLPLGFVAALFSMSHNILPESAGNSLFISLIVVFVVCTYSLALWLEGIIEFLEGVVGGFRRVALGPVKRRGDVKRKRREKVERELEMAKEERAVAEGLSLNRLVGGRRAEGGVGGDVELGNGHARRK